MLIIPHVLTGAVIARKINKPLIALPLAVASHFLLDTFPHLDSHGMFGIDGAGQMPMEKVSAVVDTALSVAIILWAVWRLPNRWYLVLGGFCGALPDLIYHVSPWGPWFHELPVFKQIGEFHAWVNYGVGWDQWVIGFGTQLIVIILMLWILRRKQKPEKVREVG